MSGRRNAWKKVLYEDQGYADNYTDKTFLRDLKRNINIKEVNIFEAAIGASIFVQELCTVIAFVLIYVYLYEEWVDPSFIFNHSSLLTICGFVIYYVQYGSNNNLGHDLRTLLIYVVFGRLFSPVLHTLTDTISTDSIYTMSFFMLLVHLIFFDYGVPVAIVSNSLSLSAAMFASICLASRLASPHHAFVLITVAVECFVLFPIFRSKIERHYITILCLVVAVLFVLYSISLASTISFVLILLFVNLVCPILFVRYQKYKENIYGPWDEAIIENAVNINDLINRKENNT